jgi:hypothetical protein
VCGLLRLCELHLHQPDLGRQRIDACRQGIGPRPLYGQRLGEPSDLARDGCRCSPVFPPLLGGKLVVGRHDDGGRVL